MATTTGLQHDTARLNRMAAAGFSPRPTGSPIRPPVSADRDPEFRDRGHEAMTSDESELCRRYAVAGDEAAFTALVEVHAGMVLSVCRRVLGNYQDAED